MKTINKHTLTIILVALTLHLWYSNSELLIAAKQLSSEKAISLFDTISLIIFALSYSLITAISVFRLKSWAPIAVFALIDGFAIYLRININHQYYIITTAVFYGFYTAYLIIVSYMLKRSESDSPTEKSEINNVHTTSQSECLTTRKRTLQNRLNATKNPDKRKAIESEIENLKPLKQ
jgi:hypothetical protein